MPVPQTLGVTPLTQEALQPYLDNGLTYTSQNPDIIKRDQAGNYVIDTNTDQLLIIDTIEARYKKRSVIRAVNTAFSYFTFPVQTEPVELELPDIDVDIDFDPVYARYRPAESNKMPAGGIYSGIEFSFVEEGFPQKATNTYYISKQIKNSGVDLRFRIRLNHRFDGSATGTGTIYFSIIKNGVNGLQRNYLEYANGDGFINDEQTQILDINVVLPNESFQIGDYFGIGALAGQNSETDFHTLNAVASYWSITDASKNVDEWNQPIE